jgi:23S rRNA A1618 N6-methylase RlmF
MCEWIQNSKARDRMQEIRTMQQMHHDFEDVIGHLNKFRVELCFTKFFGTLQAASIRNKKNALSKLQQNIITKKLTH